MSADSGLPTYRGIGGLYQDTPTPEGIPIEVVLSGQMFRSRPELTWRYLLEVEKACRDAEPNEGHRVIARLEKEKAGVWILTQNVDGLHRAAGSENVIEIHGRFSTLKCVSCEYAEVVSDYSDLDGVPGCPLCGSVVRPDVVLFGESLPTGAVDRLERESARGFDIVVSIGTTSVFPYIAEPILRARQRGVPSVEINPGTTQVSDIVDYKLTGAASDVLKQIWSELQRT